MREYLFLGKKLLNTAHPPSFLNCYLLYLKSLLTVQQSCGRFASGGGLVARSIFIHHFGIGAPFVYLPRGGSRIFFRRGCTRLLLYFNTNKPHSFFCRIPAHPLHPPPRSAPDPGLNFNPGSFFFCLKAFSRILFSIFFLGESNHQIVDGKNQTEFSPQAFTSEFKFRANPRLSWHSFEQRDPVAYHTQKS